LLTVRLHRLDFYVVLRKLIAELQAFSQCIQETPMVRFYSSIYADDELLIRQMSCDSAFHGSPHQIAAAHRTNTECLGSVPDHRSQMDVSAMTMPDEKPASAGFQELGVLEKQSISLIFSASARASLKGSLIRVRNSLFLAQRHDI
jgi:hypothetical protein